MSIPPIATGTSAATANATATPATAGRKQLHEAAQQFEAIFVRQMLSEARKARFGDSPFGTDPGDDTFAQMRDDRMADIVSRTGAFGIARQIEQSLATTAPSTGTGAKGEAK